MQFTQPMKAENAVISKLRYPLIVEPKIDGVRGLNPRGVLRTRTMKPFANIHINRLLTKPEYTGFDGELQHPSLSPTHQALCRATTSMLNTIYFRVEPRWTIFDDISESVIDLPYYRRLESAALRVLELGNPLINLTQHSVVVCEEDLLTAHALHLEAGFEGTIIRDPEGKYKNGRSTVNEGGLLRIKDFADAEARVVALVEALENTNEAHTNALGYSERSSHIENKIGKNMVGALICDFNGEMITVGPGAMTHDERIHYWAYQHQLIGKFITFKYFPHGMKNLPRFPTFKHIRRNDI